MDERSASWLPCGFGQYSNLAAAKRFWTDTPNVAGIAGNACVNADGTPVTPRHLVIKVESKDVRLRPDGTNPTAAIGAVISAGQSRTIKDSPDVIRALRAIETAATAVVTVEYYY